MTAGGTSVRRDYLLDRLFQNLRDATTPVAPKDALQRIRNEADLTPVELSENSRTPGVAASYPGGCIGRRRMLA